MSRRGLLQALLMAIVTACVLVFAGTVSAQGQNEQAFEHVREVQERHTAKLMAKEGVVGTAVGLDERDNHAVLILLERPGIGGIPQELDGVPVRPVVTGKIEAMKAPGTRIDPKSWFPRPVPIGVSTGNANEISAGTIGCRVKDAAGQLYALSNNHVYARENSAAPGELILQPGRYDGGQPLTDSIGNLFDFLPIDFSTTANNIVDAAIATTTAGALGNATPANGYGTPKSQTVAATLNTGVQKYGRTTSLTKGTITGINATIQVGYSAGTARFISQIIVQSRTPFIKAGDSGSLLVTNSRNPVGLLFAGDNSGKFAVANPIDAVLNAFDGLTLTIDGQ